MNLGLWLRILAPAIPVPVAAWTFTNGGFEHGLAGWRPLWTRDQGAGSVTLVGDTTRAGKQAAWIHHRGLRDWAFEPDLRLPVQAGEMITLRAWLRKSGPGEVRLCASLWTDQMQVVEWMYGHVTIAEGDQWHEVEARWVVPEEAAWLQPRIVGWGPASVWIHEMSLERAPGIPPWRDPNLPALLRVESRLLTVTLITSNATLQVRDHRNGKVWVQIPLHRETLVTRARTRPRVLEWEMFHLVWGRNLRAILCLEPDLAELTLELSSPGPWRGGPFRYPHPFATDAGQSLVIPMNEGISYPVEDTDVELFRLVAYGGHGLCMAFWGVTDGEAGHMAIWDTPDDAAIQLHRRDGRLIVGPEWDSQKGAWGYPRRLRYVFFAQGGHVAMAKRYRQHAQQTRRFRTLADKRRVNPAVDLLLGAVNVWCWDRDPVSLVREMQQAGIHRILWSQAQPPEGVRQLNELGVLTGRYDIYQDVMDPAQFLRLTGVHPDWPTAAWPTDLVRDAHGRWIHGWEVETREGTRIPCGVLCDLRALDYARLRIPNELATHPYRARFIDTTTASPWRECYDPVHPMSRTDSRRARLQLLRFVSEEMRLVTGSETGHDAAVPFVHYFEGMLSLGPYRVPDAGRDMSRIWTHVPEPVAKYQVGWRYRLPLWELVYHDCVVAHWYWGDYSNKLPALWDLRDLFNLLYGTPPMFMFDRRLWRDQKERFVQSYQTVCPVVRQVADQEMTDHRFLTADRAVQQTRFANGVMITVNFGDDPWVAPDGTAVPPRGYRVEISGTTLAVGAASR